MINLHPSLVPAGQWLLNSGIQAQEGGVARYYRSDTERNNPISTEITGYSASAFTYLYLKTGQDVYRQCALNTTRFLIKCAWNPELQTFPFEYPGLPPAYFFDCGIIIRGLLAVWRLSGDHALLDAAVLAGRAMAKDFDAGQDFHPILELPAKRAAPRDARWSRSSECYQLKAALAWKELAEATGDRSFSVPYQSVLKMAIATHESFLPGSPDERLVMDRLHAYCYCLEAFLMEGIDVSGGIARVSHYLREIGPRVARSDVYAQLLRLQLLSGIGLDDAAAEARDLEKFQASHSDPRIDGGFYFGIGNGEFLPFVNPVSTAFGMQALQMWREHQEGVLSRDCRMLI